VVLGQRLTKADRDLKEVQRFLKVLRIDLYVGDGLGNQILTVPNLIVMD